jgi:alkanesulfonate monooxygenase SsuD/methylene tetrahydromethanopterin reductase-like flavin-dependent oxidoreductase (luciferase family)
MHRRFMHIPEHRAASLLLHERIPRITQITRLYAEEQGFRTAWFGDHIFPWYHSGMRSAFIWSVMGVALEKTAGIKVGPWVTVPIGARYHPAIIAQLSGLCLEG